MRTSSLLALTALLAFSTSASAQTVVPVAPFKAVELRHGGRVIVRHGPVHRVTVLSGDPRCMRIEVEGQNLQLSNDGRPCRRDHRVEVEVVTPDLKAIALSHGGTIQTVGEFPRRAEFAAAVQQGGTIDIRAISADAVNASVYSGGRILTRPQDTLAASIDSGGAITYWGNPHIRRSVRHGGALQKGADEDADKPLSEMSPQFKPLPPLPPVPPVPPAPRY